jgi:hypothetical protein
MTFAHYRTFPRPLSATTGCFLDDLFVDPATRGAGAVDALLAELRRLAREHGWSVVRWITADYNHRAPGPSTTRSPLAPCGSPTTWPATKGALLGSGSGPGGQGPPAGGAGAGPAGQQGLQLAQHGIEGQPGAAAFGSRRSSVQNVRGGDQVTWRCRPRQVFSSSSRARSASGASPGRLGRPTGRSRAG